MTAEYVVTAALDGADVLALYVDRLGGHRDLAQPYVVRCPHCAEPVQHTVTLTVREVTR